MSDQVEQEVDENQIGHVPDHVDRTMPWWLLVIDMASPYYRDTVKIESNNQIDLLPRTVGINFEEYGDEEGKVQVRSDHVIKRTLLHVQPEDSTT